MNVLSGLLDQPAVHRLGWTLVHFAWQGAAIALAAFILLVALRSARAATRYRVALLLLLGMASCPVATFVILGQMRPAVESSAAVDGIGAGADVALSLPMSVGDATVDSAEPLPVPPNAADSLDPRAGANEIDVVEPTPQSQPVPSWAALLTLVAGALDRYLPWLVFGWLCGVSALSAQLLLGWRYVARLKKRSTMPPLEAERALRRLAERVGLSNPVRRSLRLLESALVHVPATIGWLRPVVLVPAGMIVGLPPAQVEAILAHELAHIRRYDYLVNLVQSWIETLLFYHPAVWWLSRRVRLEREHACDDLAVSICGDRSVYAHALVEVAQRGRAALRPAVAASGGDLQARIRRLLFVPRARSRFSPAWITGAVLLALVCGLLVTLAAAGIENSARQRLESTKANLPPETVARADEATQAVEQANASEPDQADALPEGVLIRVQVLDDETGKPIDRFRVLAGSKSHAGRDDGGPLPAVWQPHTIRETKSSTFDWPQKQSYDEMRLRIEADSYQPFATDWIKKDDKPRVITLRLKRDPGIAGRVLRPDGQSAAGAMLAVALTNRDIRLEGKSIAGTDKPPPDKLSDRWRIPHMVKTDAYGRFQLPTETESCAMLCVVHDAGYLQLAFSQLSGAELGPAGAPRELKLAAWGRIEGKVRWKDRVGAGETISMIVFRDFPGGAYPGAMSSSARTETDAQGRFTFDNVPPGLVQISRLVKLPTGELGHYQLPITHASVKAGQPTRVLLGGQGNTVTGRVKGLASYEGVTVRIAPNAPHIGFPGDDEQWKGFAALQASPVGPLYFRGNIPIAKDGSFRIEGVLPAYYQLFLDSKDRSVMGGSKFHVEAETESPDGKPSADNKPQDIGEIRATRRPVEKPKPGSEPVAQTGLLGGFAPLGSQSQRAADNAGPMSAAARQQELGKPETRGDADITVNIQVLDASTDLPIEHFGVRALKEGEPIENPNWTYSEGRGGEAKPDGRFQTTVSRSAAGTVCVFSNGYLPQLVLNERPADAAREMYAVVRLKPGIVVRGRVLNHEGKPVTNAGVYGASTHGGLRLSGGRAVGHQGFGFLAEDKEIKRDVRVATDRAGRFRIVVDPTEQIAVSTLTIDAWAVPLPEQGKDVVIRLPQPARLVVHYDIDGGPPKEHIFVQLLRTKTPGLEPVVVHHNAEVTNGGEVAVDTLPPGVYAVGRVRVVQSDKAYFGSLLDRTFVSLEAGKTTSVDMTRPDGMRVSGRVLGLDAAGLKSVMVMVLPNPPSKPPYDIYRGFPGWLMRDVCLTDAKGRFTTERLSPGSYRIHIEEGDNPGGPFAFGRTSSEFFGEAVVEIPKSEAVKEVPLELHLYRRVDAAKR